MEDPKLTAETPKTNPNYLNGVFYFSNASEEDFVALWNNVEYIFPAMTCSPMLIANEPPENVQEIRKRFALTWAQKQWYAGREYKKMVKEGGRIPAIPNEKVYEPLIQMCLNPLPIVQVKTKKKGEEKTRYKGSKPVNKKDNLNEIFKDDAESVVAQLPED